MLIIWNFSPVAHVIRLDNYSKIIIETVELKKFVDFVVLINCTIWNNSN